MPTTMRTPARRPTRTPARRPQPRPQPMQPQSQMPDIQSLIAQLRPPGSAMGGGGLSPWASALQSMQGQSIGQSMQQQPQRPMPTDEERMRSYLPPSGGGPSAFPSTPTRAPMPVPSQVSPMSMSQMPTGASASGASGTFAPAPPTADPTQNPATQFTPPTKPGMIGSPDMGAMSGAMGANPMGDRRQMVNARMRGLLNQAMVR